MFKLLIKLIFAILFACFSFFAGFAFNGFRISNLSGQSYSVLPTSRSAPKVIDEDELFSMVNTWRAENGLNPYKIDAQLCGFATVRVKEIKLDWSHSGMNARGSTGSRELFKWGLTRVGENLSKDFDTSKDTLDAWLLSADHKKNLTTDFANSCVRCEDNYCVQLFGNY